MGHLVEADIVEEGVELDVLYLLLVNHQSGYGLHDVLELGFHGVLELQTACAVFQLHLLIVGQIDGYGLAAGIAFAGIVDHVVDIEVAIGAGALFFVFGVAGQLFLHLGQHLGEML